jgi:NAD(P)-dependent dehydrogenase (short-subunit alcohol dehydrogenase family)
MSPANSAAPIAIVTGASRGIGAEFVRQLLAKNYEVHAVTRNADRLREAVRSPEGTARLYVHAIDLETKDGPERLAAVLEGRPVALLVNNAGIYLESSEAFDSIDFQEVRRSFEVNTLIAARVCQALLPVLKKAPHPKVVQITSLMGSITDNESGGSYAYRMSKAALNMFNQSFAQDYPEFTALVLHPGWVRTDMGGTNAPTTPEASVRGMLKVIDQATAKDSGKFYDFEGNELPW